jgi:hypothetical protein
MLSEQSLEFASRQPQRAVRTHEFPICESMGLEFCLRASSQRWRRVFAITVVGAITIRPYQARLDSSHLKRLKLVVYKHVAEIRGVNSSVFARASIFLMCLMHKLGTR